MPDGRIAYVDFGNVAELSQTNKQTLIDAIVHAVNEDYEGMAEDFIKLVSLFTVARESSASCVCSGFCMSHDVTFIVQALLPSALCAVTH